MNNKTFNKLANVNCEEFKSETLDSESYFDESQYILQGDWINAEDSLHKGNSFGEVNADLPQHRFSIREILISS